MQQLKFIQRHYRQILPMALLIAWFWCFPLFGPLQSEIPAAEEGLISFSLFILAGMISGHLLMAGSLPERLGSRLPKVCFSVLLVGMLLLLAGFGERFLVSFLPFVMGLAGGAYFVFWGVSIYHVEPGEKGRYMGLMMIVASIFQALILSFYEARPAFGLWYLAILLTAGLVMAGQLGFTSVTPSGNKADNGNKGLKLFWMPFGLLILCYYILSWITHNSFYPYILETTAIGIFWGPLIYGSTAWLAGCLMDRSKHLNQFAVIGLVLMGCTFLSLSLGQLYQRKLPLHLLFESSYAFLDLFVWVSLAAVAAQYRLLPQRSYAIGLFINGLIVLLGVTLQVSFANLAGTATIYSLAALAGMVLFIGVIPAFGMEKIKLKPQENEHSYRLSDILVNEVEEVISGGEEIIEKLTPREKEVLYLMLMGFSNNEIQEEISVTKNTLKTHIRNIYGKIEVKNRSELSYKLYSFIYNQEDRGDSQIGRS